MAQEQTAVIKGCKSCAFLANGNYGSCRDIMSSNGQSCFGSRKEIANNSGKYLYRKWKSKYDKTPMAELKYQAYCDIVLEGSVKAGVKLYISSENLPSTTFDNLYLVCENCGYLMYKGNWTDSIQVIHIVTDRHYKLTYHWATLKQIDCITEENIYISTASVK